MSLTYYITRSDVKLKRPLLPPPFEVPIAIGSMDCLMQVRIVDFTPSGGDGWTEPFYPAEIECEIDYLRQDNDASWAVSIPDGLALLLGRAADLGFHCLDALIRHNQPPED